MSVKVDNKDVKRGIKVYLDGKEVAANATAIRAKMKEIEKELKNMTIGSEDYRKKVKDWEKLNGILKEHKSNLRAIAKQQETVEGGFKSMWKRGLEFFQKYSLQITSVIQGLTGVAMKLSQFRRQAAEQEDAAANLKALTGLDDNNIAWLEQQAEKLSTTMEASGLRVRKSVKEILEAYMLVGSAKPELLSDKEALNAVTVEAMRLAEAAKMDLKEAVEALTGSLNQYSEGADQAARYTNVLAAGSKFGAANVQDQAKAVLNAGVAASSANVSFEQLVGVIEMLGEKGIKAEEAGTALKRFFLKLQTDADDTNPAIVGLDKALENLAAKHLSMGELQKMFGDRAINVAKILIDNTDKVKQYTEAVTDTNVATEQARINSDTTAAKMAQVRNQINLTGQALAKDLAPIISKTVNWTNKFVMAMPVMIDWLKKYGGELLVLAAAYATYTYGVRVADAVTKAWHATVLFFTTGIGKMRAAVVLTTTAINFNSKAMIQMGLQMRSMNAITKLFVATQALVRAGFLAITGQATQAARAMTVARMAVAAINPWAAAATAIAAVGTAIYFWSKKAKEAMHTNELLKQAQDDAAARYDEQRTKIEYLNKVVHDETLGYQRRNTALEELKRLVPDYHASLTQEGKLIDDNVTAIDKYLERLKKEIMLKALQEQFVESLMKERKAREEMEEYERRAARKYNQRKDIEEGKGPISASPITAIPAWLGSAAAEQYYDYKKNQAKKALDDAKKDGEQIQKMVDDLTHQLDSLLGDAAGSTGGSGGAGSSSGPGSTDTDRQKRIREAIEAINAEYDARANDLKQQFLDGQIESEEEYSRRLQDIELERLNKQLEIAGMEPAQREQIRGKILDMKMKLMEQLKQLDEKQRKEAEEAAKKAAEERIKIAKEELDGLLLQVRVDHARELTDEKHYDKQVADIRRAFFRKMLSDQSLTAEQRKQIESEYTEFLAREEEKRAESTKETLDTVKDYAQDFGEAVGTLITSILKDEEDAGKQFLKAMLKLVLKTVRQLAVEWEAALTAKNFATMAWPAAIATSAAEVAAIEVALAAAEAAVNSFQKGGYTGSGRPDEERGVVHAGEFVANRYAVANDAVRPVLDLIDQAQRNGSIANLTAEQIAAVARPSAATAPTATVPAASASGVPLRDPELTAALRLLIRTTERAAEAYREPSMAYTFADGRGGVNEAQELLARMKDNASRKH